MGLADFFSKLFGGGAKEEAQTEPNIDPAEAVTAEVGEGINNTETEEMTGGESSEETVSEPEAPAAEEAPVEEANTEEEKPMGM